MTRAQNLASAAWLRDQLRWLAGYIHGNPQRWPHARIVTAILAILAGNEQWRLAAADVLQTERR